MSKKDRDTILDGPPGEDPAKTGLPAVAAEYIKLVIKKMRYRRKVQREVTAELADHFLEALQDCTNDEQKNQRAKELIDEFGDAKMLGILMRRAKKRCRPLWRTVAAHTFQTVGVMVVLLILYLVWFASGRPVITKDYVAEYNKLVRPSADESLNAAPFYNRAARIIEGDDNETKQLLGTIYDKVTDQNKADIKNWLQENEQAIELVVTGTGKPYYWRSYESPEGEMMGVLMPHLGEYRIAAYALQWRAWLSAEQGRFDNAFDDIRTCYRLGRHLAGDTILVEQLVGMAIRSLAMRTIRTILSEHNAPADAMAALQKDLEAMTDDDDFIVSVKAEKLFMLDEIQRCFTESRFGPSHLYPRRLTALSDMGVFREDDLVVNVFWLLENWPNALHIIFTHPGREESVEMVNEYYSYWYKIMRKTPAELAAEGINPEKQSAQIVKDNVLLRYLSPAMRRVHEIAYRNKADVESTFVLLALLRYKQDTDKYPQDIEQLHTSGYLDQIPIDPFSGKTYSYKVTEDSFLLYSFGADLDDDGGEVFRDEKGRVRKWANEGDWVFWPLREN